MGICGAFWRETKLMAGNYPFSRRHRGPARRFACFHFVWSSRARLGKPGMVWARRMDKSSNSGENEKLEARLGRISPSRCKKRVPGAHEATRSTLIRSGQYPRQHMRIHAWSGVTSVHATTRIISLQNTACYSE
jgi:hypothetical protein